VLSAATADALSERPALESLDDQFVKGRETPVSAFRLSTIA
jgi:class 3 adenylate cyclase